MTEFELKQNRIQALLAKHHLEALLLQRVSSFAWATCGAASYINTAATTGEASLLITPSRRYVITNNIEAPHYEHEEQLRTQGWEFQINPWYEAPPPIAAGLKLGADVAYPGAVNLAGEIAHMRADLLPEEGKRFRTLGRLCAEAMNSAIRAVRPGQTEQQLAAMLAQEAQSRGAQPTVVLIATDDRIFRFRHPLPAGKKLERYAMLILCGRQRGLVASITRLIHFGPLPAELRHKMQATARVDAAYIAATRPGRSLDEVFRRAAAAYAETGFANEWQLHHQGGSAGYEPREYLGLPGGTEVVAAGQAYAWNPSITGTKSEDTILVGEEENEVLTAIAGWPMLTVELADGQKLARPAVLEVL
jgi:Xaa-Pro aminopeptidase